MNSQGTITIVFISIIAVFAGIEDYVLTLPIGLGILNAIVNKKMIDKFKVGKVYHYVQLAILIAIMGILIWTKLIEWNQVLLMTGFYWFSFEYFLNIFRGRDWDYIGNTAYSDKLIRRVFKRYSLARTFLTVVKIFAIVGGLALIPYNN